MQFMNLLVLMLASVGAGVSSTVQQAVNAGLRSMVCSAAWAGVISYFVGTACMLIFAIALRDPIPSSATLSHVSWWGWTGGFFGSIFIGLSIILVPRLGAATFVALVVAGQMIASLAIDHYGVFNVSQHPADFSRIAGILLLLAGVVLIRF
jgi:transporter family-2 protein